MEILILLILFVVVWAITSNYFIIHDIAKKKGYEHNRKNSINIYVTILWKQLR